MAMLRPVSPFGVLGDHVPGATGEDALMYLAAIALWLIGVVAVVVRKLRSA